MLNILMIGHQRRFKIEARLASMARSLVRRGHRVTLLCLSDHQRWAGREEIVDGVRVVESPDLFVGRARSGWDPWCTFSRLCYLRKSKDFDIIHSHETRPASLIPARSTQRRLQIPWVTDWIDWWGRGGLIELQRPWLYRRTLGPLETYFEEAFRARAQGVSVISHALGDRAEALGVPRDRIEWVPGGCAPELFPDLSPSEARRLESLPPSGPLVLFAGMDVLFDLPIILESMLQVRRRFPEARLVVTGAAADRVRELCGRAGLPEGAVIPTGPLAPDRYRRTLLAADVCVLPLTDHPANRGRWPNKVGDYFSAGKPVVSNPVGEMDELLRRHDVGILVEATAAGFAGGIVRLLENPDEASRKGAEGRRVSEGTLSWGVLAGKLEAFYLRILAGFRPGERRPASKARSAPAC